MKKILFSVLVLFVMMNLASVSQAGKVYEVVKPEVTIKLYKVKKGDTLSKICKDFYGSVKPSTYKALANWKKQVIHKKLWVFVDQVLEIPSPLVLTQRRIGQNPTTIPIEKSAKLSVRQLKKSLKQANIQVDVSDGLSDEIVSGLENSQESHRLNGELAITASFDKKVQGWTEIDVDEDFYGKSTIIDINNDRSIRAVWAKEQCNNLYLQVIKEGKPKVFALSPPPPMYPPPPPPPMIFGELKIKETQEAIAQYKKIQTRWDWDSTWGGFDERYDDGNHVRGWWQSSTIYPFISNDINGNEWALGINFTSRNWTGETGEDNPFHYLGDVDIWSLASRFRSRNWEILARAGLGERKDEGYLTNQWGRYDMNQETNISNFYSSAEYNGRKDKTWFSKIRVSGEIELDLNHKKQDFWTDSWDGRQPLNGEPDDKDSYGLALYTDILNLYKKDVQLWGEVRTTYYREGPRWYNVGKLGLSFLDGSFKIGYGVGSVANKHEKDPKMGKINTEFHGLYAEVSLYNLWYNIFGYEEGDAWDFNREVEGAGYQSIMENISDKSDVWDFDKKTENSGY